MATTAKMYIARDISFLDNGRLATVQLIDYITQSIEYYFNVHFKEFIGKRMRTVQDQMLSKIEAQRLADDFVNNQKTTLNYSEYDQQERVKSIVVTQVLISNDQTEVDMIIYLGTGGVTYKVLL